MCVGLKMEYNLSSRASNIEFIHWISMTKNSKGRNWIVIVIDGCEVKGIKGS